MTTRAHKLGISIGCALFAQAFAANAQDSPPPPPQAPAAPQTPHTPQTPQTPQTPVTPTPPAAPPVVVVNPDGTAALPPSRTVVVSSDEHEVGDANYWGAPLITGAAVFLVSYGAAAIAGADSNRRGDNHLVVPIAGPWIDLGTRGDCPVATSSCDHETSVKVLLVVDGLFQAASLVSLLDGVLDPGRAQVVRTADRGVHVQPTAMATPEGTAPGFALSGGF